MVLGACGGDVAAADLDDVAEEERLEGAVEPPLERLSLRGGGGAGGVMGSREEGERVEVILCGLLKVS